MVELDLILLSLHLLTLTIQLLLPALAGIFAFVTVLPLSLDCARHF